MARPPSKRLLRASFDYMNREFFGGVLPSVDLEIVDIPYYGFFSEPDEAHPFGWIGLSRREVPSCGWLGVLLHECLHGYLYFMDPEDDEFDSDSVAGHGPRFTEEANRVGRALGLPAVDEADSWAWPWVLEEDEDIEPIEDE